MKTRIFPLLAIVVSLAIPAGAAERHMMQPLVPDEKLAEARALASPLPSSPKIVEQGKALYNGKGACFNCHGKDGDGNGPLAAQLDPSPRNFQHPGFWRHRTEGEIFWVIKNGSVGSSMVGFDGQLTDEEIWSLIQYVRTFAGEHGPGMMEHGLGMGPVTESNGGLGGMKLGGSRGGWVVIKVKAVLCPTHINNDSFTALLVLRRCTPHVCGGLLTFATAAISC